MNACSQACLQLVHIVYILLTSGIIPSPYVLTYLLLDAALIFVQQWIVDWSLSSSAHQCDEAPCQLTVSESNVIEIN